MRQIQTALLVAFGLSACHASAADCYESSIVRPSPFMGNNGEVFQLADGSLWEVKYEYEYMYDYYPEVIICPGNGVLIIDDSRLDVELVSSPQPRAKPAPRQKSAVAASAIESQIAGDFEGWGGETIVKLVNGQVWQQASYHYEYTYSFMPEVLIYQTNGVYKMKVEGADEAVEVIRLR